MASRTTPTRAGSRFAALDPDTFGDPNATPRPSGSGKQRQQEDEGEEESPSPTPASTRPASPTATLFPAFSFHEYHWNGHVFDSLEEAITASAQGHNIPQAISSWVINVVKDLPTFVDGRVALLGDAVSQTFSCICATAHPLNHMCIRPTR